MKNLIKAAQDDFKKGDQIYFLHIPKTGGTTLTKYIDSFYGAADIFPNQLWNHYLPTLTKPGQGSKKYPMEGYSLVRGHFGYGVYREMGTLPTTFVMLREPVDRFISQFYHVKRDPIFNSWYRPDFVFPGEDINTFVGDKNRLSRMSNVITKYLGCDIDFKDQVLKSNYDTAGLYFDSSELLNITIKNQQDILVSSRQRLDTMTFIGLQEYFQESLIYLAFITGWPIKRDEERHMDFKSNPGVSSLSEETKLAIEESNRFDIQTYAYGRDLFFERYRAACEEVLGRTVDMNKIKTRDQLMIDEMYEALKSKNGQAEI